MESSRLKNLITEQVGKPEPHVVRVAWSADTVWLNASSRRAAGHPVEGTDGFRGVSEAVWTFKVGGYQVCDKWLKDRKGRPLSEVDVAHYQKIVVAISETIRLMAEIDEVIEEHGGWPGAFVTSETEGTG